MNEILEKIKLLNTHFQTTGTPEKEGFLQRIIKLNEEVGELCEAALYEVDVHQRKKEKEIDFDAELADVIICALLLGQNRKKNILDTISQTLDKNLQRLNLQ